MKPTKKELIAFVTGLVVSVSIGMALNYIYSPQHNDQLSSSDDEYHTHADFHIVVKDTLVSLDDERFQTTNEQKLHEHAHLHDNNGDVAHFHEADITLAEFLDSLGITLTDECITLDNTYCANETEALLLFVDGTLFTSPITQYVPADDEQILLYYGSYDMDVIQPHIDTVPNDACYYSGTCPERGVAPPESCGGTCEL